MCGAPNDCCLVGLQLVALILVLSAVAVNCSFAVAVAVVVVGFLLLSFC